MCDGFLRVLFTSVENLAIYSNHEFKLAENLGFITYDVFGWTVNLAKLDESVFLLLELQ